MTARTTIIIPFFNVENTILRCLESVASQTIEDIEVLLIDDCSHDRTSELAEDFITNYDGDISFRIIRLLKNQGQSAARNRGIKEATGEFIYFLDSDDYISKDCIELLTNEITKAPDVEMVIGNYKIVGPLFLAPFTLQQRCYTSEEIIQEQLRFGIYTMPWNKLIRKDFLISNHLFFQEGIVHEDNLWSFCSAFCFNKISVLLSPTYYYVIRQGSTERSHDRDWHLGQLFEVYKYLVRFIFESDAPSKKDVKSRLDVFRFFEKDMVTLVMEPYVKGNWELSFQRYSEIRELPHWTWNDLSHIGASWKDRFLFMHFTLSVPNGYKTFIRQHAKYKISKEMNTMKISVITVNYNNLKGLRRTLPSILSQTYTGYELIVVDGGSTDGSKEYIQACDRIDQWVSEPDRGVYNAMNKAVKMAHGEFCIFMNSGDTFFSSVVLENVIGKLQDKDFYTGLSTFIEDKNTYTCTPPLYMSIDFLLVNSLNHQSTFIKTAFLKEHPYNETYKITADWGLFTKAWLLGRCTYEKLSDMIAIYYVDGLSSVHKDVAEKEREAQFNEIVHILKEDVEYTGMVEAIQSFYSNRKNVQTFHPKCAHSESLKSLRHRHKLIEKIDKAMSLPPLQRDLKIARNALKMFFKDLF